MNIQSKESNLIKRVEKLLDESGIQIYNVEYNYGDGSPGLAIGHIKVKANSEEEALEKAEKYASNKHYRDDSYYIEDSCKIVKSGYSNDPIIESSQKNEDVLTKDILNNALYSDSFMRDRAYLTADNIDYIKIGKDEWQSSPRQSHALGAIYTTDQLWGKIKTAKELKLDGKVYSKTESINESEDVSNKPLDFNYAVYYEDEDYSQVRDVVMNWVNGEIISKKSMINKLLDTLDVDYRLRKSLRKQISDRIEDPRYINGLEDRLSIGHIFAILDVLRERPDPVLKSKLDKNESIKEAESIYDPRTILKAYNIEKAWLEHNGIEPDETVPQVLLFIINDYKQILDTHAVDKKDIYTYEPEENEYYLDMVRDSGDVLTDYNLEPAQKLVDRWNEGNKWESLLIKRVEKLLKNESLNESVSEENLDRYLVVEPVEGGFLPNTDIEYTSEVVLYEKGKPVNSIMFEFDNQTDEEIRDLAKDYFPNITKDISVIRH